MLLNFITDSIVNISSLLLIINYKLEDVLTVFDATQSTSIFTQKKPFNIKDRLPVKINKFLLFPFLTENGTWALVFVNIKDCYFACVDPTKKNFNNKVSITIQLNKFLKSVININNDIENVNIAFKEVDGPDSGYTVLILIEMICKSLKNNSKFDFNQLPNMDIFKKNILNLLLTKSENISLRCMQCQKQIKPNVQYFSCKFCFKSTCKDCQNIDYFCKICSCFMCK